MTAQLLGTTTEDLHRAAALLRNGGVVAVPTETVYGLAASASLPEAVRRVFEIKGRPLSHPLILHVASVEAARQAALEWTASAGVLARSFWPGPLAILLQRSKAVDPVVTGGRDSVVLRIPRHSATLALLEQLHAMGSLGLAAPSANRFGAVSPTTAQHVMDDLGDRIDAVIDGGPCDIGVESTIVDCRASDAVVLRPGGVAVEEISAALAPHGIATTLSPHLRGVQSAGGAIASGMLASHYAPRTAVEVFQSREALSAARLRHEAAGRRCVDLPAPADDFEYSRQLFASLRACDAVGADVILALLPHPSGLGTAIRDRLLKAAADRSSNAHNAG